MDRTEEAQRERKRAWVERCLNRCVDSVIPSALSTGYRARIRLVPDGAGGLGYHPPRSHAIVTAEQCPIARPEINRSLAAAASVPRSVEHIEFRSDGERVVVSVESAARRRDKVCAWASACAEADFAGAAIAVNGRTIRGDTKVGITVAGISHRFSPATFYQVNLDINRTLVADVIAAVEARGPTCVLDAYAGAGNLSLPLAAQGIKVVQIESHPNAVSDGRATAKRLGIDVEVRRQRAEDFQSGDVFFEVAIVDPPRAGAGALIPKLLLTRPAAVVMISCNPRTLARDVRLARDAGYELTSLAMYDMFPQTDHVECMGILERI
jgi:23S rRNA (uracil1939-C5)-methyltransferase